jgi:asparagine synthase (glutamine-hydrolysing)
MCGIVGILSLGGAPVDPVVLQRMNDRPAHRGPDGAGYLLAWPADGRLAHAFVRDIAAWDRRADARIALGHRRLAILDLSERGIQPMAADGGGTWIVFNGEIYNHRALRVELERAGYTFTTRTDTEVLLQAYQRWGEACLERIQGMFAFAIWDGGAGRLFCARDRLGIKPFYYATPPGHLVFASEIKALLAFPALTAVADDDAVVDYLVHANCDYGERTVFRGVRALPAGHALSVDFASGRVRVRRYWELSPPAARNGTSDAAHLERLKRLLLDTTRTHLISDVRAGSCLSGGLDSSTVVSLIGKLWREQPEAATAVGDRFFTFTSCWDYPELDERSYALSAAQAMGATPHLVFPSAADFWGVFEKMAWHQDMPFPSTSYYAQWSVMRAAREAGVKVLLDGQGGDEVFGGYAKFRYAYLMSLLRSGRWGRMAREVGAMVRQGDVYVLDLRRGYRYLPGTLRRLLGVDSLLRGILRTDWSRAVASESTPATRWWRYASNNHTADSGWSMMQRIQVDDLLVDTLPLLLRMEDRSSMAFSLEARVPLLDHVLVEYGVGLPDHLKVHDGWSKFAIREVMRGAMPDRVRLRTTKLGFAAPDRHWLTKELRPVVADLIGGQLRSARYVDPAPLRRWYDAPRARSASTEAHLGLFRVLALEMWMRAFNVS